MTSAVRTIQEHFVDRAHLSLHRAHAPVAADASLVFARQTKAVLDVERVVATAHQRAHRRQRLVVCDVITTTIRPIYVTVIHVPQFYSCLQTIIELATMLYSCITCSVVLVVSLTK